MIVCFVCLLALGFFVCCVVVCVRVCMRARARVCV